MQQVYAILLATSSIYKANHRIFCGFTQLVGIISWLGMRFEERDIYSKEPTAAKVEAEIQLIRGLLDE